MDFVELLKFYKDKDNFPSQVRKSFDKFSEVSKSDDEVFIERTHAAIDRVENDDEEWLPADDFLKELETW